MRYDHELILISQDIQTDQIGNQIPVESQRSVLCSVKSTGRTEYYAAATAGLKPEFIFTMYAFEYNQEQQVIFNDQRYRVIRTYSTNMKEIELTCERVVGDVEYKN